MTEKPLDDVADRITERLRALEWYAALIAASAIYFALQDMSDKYCWPSRTLHTPEWCKKAEIEMRTE